MSSYYRGRNISLVTTGVARPIDGAWIEVWGYFDGDLRVGIVTIPDNDAPSYVATRYVE